MCLLENIYFGTHSFDDIHEQVKSREFFVVVDSVAIVENDFCFPQLSKTEFAYSNSLWIKINLVKHSHNRCF